MKMIEVPLGPFIVFFLFLLVASLIFIFYNNFHLDSDPPKKIKPKPEPSSFIFTKHGDLTDKPYSQRNLHDKILKDYDKMTPKHWDKLWSQGKFSEWFLEAFITHVNWSIVCNTHKDLSYGFILKYKNHINWIYLTAYRTFTENEILQFADYIHWDVASEFQVLTDDIIIDYADRVDWDRLARFQILSEDIIREFIFEFDTTKLLRHQKHLSNEFIKWIINPKLNKIIAMTAKDYITKGEEWCTANADIIDWDVFEYHADVFSMKFSDTFEGDIQKWKLNGHYHREDGPAHMWPNRDKAWYKHGEIHREDGPAVEWVNGGKFWYKHGKFHREDGPAVIRSNGGKEWCLNGRHHREDGPAIEWESGTKEWYLNGDRHRADGPAIEWANGEKEWYLNGDRLTEEQFNERTRLHR